MSAPNKRKGEPRCDLCHAHAATADFLHNAGPLGFICSDQVACSRRQLARRGLSDEQTLAAARGVAQVDRAVHGYRRGTGRVSFHVPGRAA